MLTRGKGLGLLLAAIFFGFALYGCGSEDGGSDLIQITFQSKWWPQSQFAGYYIAGGHEKDGLPSGHVPLSNGKNFYEEEGLDVTILPGNNVNPSMEVAQGRADFGTDWIANFLLSIQTHGLDLVHVMQVFQRPGFELVSQKTANITLPEDLIGKKVGIWSFGNEFPVTVCLKKHNITSDLDQGEPNPQVTTVVYPFDPAQVWPDKVDLASAMVYNELDQIVGLGYPLEQLNRMSTASIDCGLLEDFLFTSSELLADSNFKNSGLTGKEVAQRFLRATLKGWNYLAESNNDQEKEQTMLNVVLDFCASLDSCKGSGTTQSAEIHQKWQLSRVRELVQPGILGGSMVTVGCLNSIDYEKTRTLLTSVNFITENTGLNVVDKTILQGIGVNCN